VASRERNKEDAGSVHGNFRGVWFGKCASCFPMNLRRVGNRNQVQGLSIVAYEGRGKRALKGT
jgi:hypothetical protein